MNSVSSAVMYGKTAKCGTGLVNVKSVDKIPTKTITIDEDDDLDDIEEVILKIKKSKKSGSSRKSRKRRKAKINGKK